MAVTDFDTWPYNYTGDFWLSGANSRRVPFTTMMGGIGGARTLHTKSVAYPTSVLADLDAGAQPDISEDTAQTAPTAVTTTTAQVYSTVGIYHEQRAITYIRNSDLGTIHGLAVTDGGLAITDPREFQIQMGLAQLIQDFDKASLQGSYQAAAASNTSGKSRGLVGICASGTNTVAAGAANISKAFVNTLLEEMWNAGAPFTDPVAFVGSGFVKSKISDVWGYAPTNRTVGGVNIETIVTDYCNLGVVLCPNLDASLMLIADMSVVFPVVLPTVTDKGAFDILVEDLGKVGAKTGIQIYAQLGMASGPEHYHGTLTGIATA